MAKTFGELILEYENFQHSKEHFDLMKECYEIDLMNQYVESQQFMMENVAEIREEYKEFDESFFIEAADKETVKDVAKTAAEKSNGFIKKMWKKFIEAMKNVWSFFKRIYQNLRKQNVNLEKFEEKYKDKISTLLERIDEDRIAVITTNAWPQTYTNAGFELGMTDTANIVPHLQTLINGIKNAGVKNKLHAAFSRDNIKVKLLAKDKSNKSPCVMDADKFTKLVMEFGFGQGSTTEIGQNTENTRVGNIGKVFKDNTFTRVAVINVSDTSNDEITKQLAGAEEKLKSMLATENQVVSIYNGKDAMELYNKLLAICADTMNMYNYVFSYRGTVITQLDREFTKLLSGVKNKKSNNDPNKEKSAEGKDEE